MVKKGRRNVPSAFFVLKKEREGATRTLAGQEFKELTYAVDASKTLGYSLDQTMLVKKKGDRMIVIVFSYSGAEQLQKLMDGFSAL